MKKKYDVAAYIWPSYCNDKRSRIFWPSGIGEWETVISNKPKFNGHTQPRKPLWGYINEADPYVMEMQINAAADHGVNIFIYDWYWYDRRPFLEGCLNNGYLKARNNDRVKFFLMWANHDAGTVWDKRLSDEDHEIVWYGSVDRIEFEKLCGRLINNYFSHPSYYRIEDKPVFMIYDLNNLIKGLGGIKQTRDALEWFREYAVMTGLGGIHLQCSLRKNTGFNLTGISGDDSGTQKEIIDALGFEGITHYQFCHFADIDRDYMEIMKDVIKEWDEISMNFNASYFPHVSVGWDNNPRFWNFKQGIAKSNEPENFEKALKMARDFVDAHPNQAPLITLNSWNEWTETSYLQPDSLYGYGYLDAVKQVFGGK